MILDRIPGPHGFNLIPIMFCYGCERLVVTVWATWLAPVMLIVFLVLYWSFPNNCSGRFLFVLNICVGKDWHFARHFGVVKSKLMLGRIWEHNHIHIVLVHVGGACRTDLNFRYVASMTLPQTAVLLCIAGGLIQFGTLRNQGFL